MVIKMVVHKPTGDFMVALNSYVSKKTQIYSHLDYFQPSKPISNFNIL